MARRYPSVVTGCICDHLPFAGFFPVYSPARSLERRSSTTSSWVDRRWPSGKSRPVAHKHTNLGAGSHAAASAAGAAEHARARTQVVELRIVLDAFRAHVLLELREKIVSSVAARRDPAALDDHVLPRHSLLSPAVVLVVAFHLRRCGRSAVRRARRRQPRRRRLAHPDDREDRDLCADVAATGRGVVGARDPVLASLAIQYVGSGDLDGHRAPLCACSPAASEASFTAEKIVPGRSGGYQGYH